MLCGNLAVLTLLMVLVGSDRCLLNRLNKARGRYRLACTYVRVIIREN